VRDDVASPSPDAPLRAIIGAGEQRWPGWLPTQRDELDLLDEASWAAFFGERRADALLCEHVWEHLTEAEGRAAAARCFRYLRPGGYLRVAVPDANFRDPDYQRTVQIGGPGPRDHPAAGHRVVYDHRRFAAIFTGARFVVDPLEWCDKAGRFTFRYWDPADGPIYRSLRADHRNRDGKLGFVSLILDAHKPQ
jgi:predicted SAM-dependent methyltransferase